MSTAALKALLAFPGRRLFPVGADKRPLSTARPYSDWSWRTEDFTDAELLGLLDAGHRLALVPATVGLWVADVDEGTEDAWDTLSERFAPPIGFARTRAGYHAFYGLPGDDTLTIRNRKWQLGPCAGELRGHNGYVVLWDIQTAANAAEYAQTHPYTAVSPFPTLVEERSASGPGVGPPSTPKGAEKPSKRLKEALKFLSPKVLGPTPEYDRWIAIGQAVHHETGGHPDGFALWDHWSQRFDNYPGEGEPTTAAKWQSFHSHDDGVTGGTIWNLAEELGWHEDFTEEFEELPPLPDTIGKTGQLDLIGSVTVKQDPEEIPHLSQGMFADAWVKHHQRNWLYDPRQETDRRWHRWRKNRWTTGDESAPMRSMQLMIREQCRLIARHAEDSAKMFRGLLATYDKLAVIQPCLTLASERLKHRRWDTNPNILGIPDGALIDLTTGEIRPQKQTDYVTRSAACLPADDYGTLWPKLLDTWTHGDTDLERYLQVAAGYSLFGTTREQVFFIIHGPGKTGKSVFIEVLSAIFGNYGHTAPMSLFTGRSDQHPTDLADMDGPRFVRTSETETGTTWRTDILKNLTGGDEMSARFMRNNSFQFTPTCTLFIVLNHPPSFRGGLVDSGMERRIQAIRWTNVIPVDRRVRDLPRTLKEKHLPHIFRWALDGAREYLKLNGLPPCEAVAIETREYIGMEDTVGDFLEQRCLVGPDQQVSAGELQATYKAFCEDNFRHEVTTSVWAQELRNRGMTRRKTRKGWVWFGLTLDATAEQGFSGPDDRNSLIDEFDVLDSTTRSLI